MAEDHNELNLTEESVARALPSPSSGPQVSKGIQVSVEQQVEESAPESQSSAESTDEEQSPVPPKPAADARSALEKQPYDFEKCTIQIAIQLLPDDGDAKGRSVLLGVRSHLDAPIVRMLRADELGALPPVLTALIEQLKSELPAREQAAKERAAKAEEEAQRRVQAVKANGKRGKTANAKPAPVPAPAPKPSVLTDEQRANAVAQVATDDKQQLSLF